jgi:hypothetical protein
LQSPLLLQLYLCRHPERSEGPLPVFRPSWRRRPRDDTQPKITYHVKYQKDQMAEHIEDLQQRFAELNKRIQLVRSFL